MNTGPTAGGKQNAPQTATPRMLRSVSGSMRSSSDQTNTPQMKANVALKQVPTMSGQSLQYPQQRQDKELLPPAAIGQGAPGNKKTAPLAMANAGNLSNSPNPSNAPPQKQGTPASDQALQQFYRRSIGDWDFIRTIGAGSMGKVKLAKHNSTGEKCAVKIVPRAAKLFQRAHANDPPLKSQEEVAQRQKEYEKEVARDKRTIREGALGRLLFHPHICRLYEMVPMTNHYYMLFEYVEGGQLLDYIVSHGSLNEKYARKFARGIASALDYCHKNNVVHRDLKIENIMINKDGEIKIIDFGLSNLYTPHHLLKTYCGSLYFAAPELLCAKPYTGPEVDVWSFGVVLYVLVCGKVPFDDPVVSALHDKIKKGNVEYPSFISRECVSLLSRMLVVDPAKRATLSEVIQHPWMNKGFEFLTPSYAPKRTPLTLPLDPQIIQTIASLDLGTVSSITDELTLIISSPDYQLSSDNWHKIAKHGRHYQSYSADPVYGFHPLVSIYYLVDEMKKRKKAKEEAMKSHLRQQYSESSTPQSTQPGPWSQPTQALRSPSQQNTLPPMPTDPSGRVASRLASLNRPEQPSRPELPSNPFNPGYNASSMPHPRSPPPPPQQKPPTLQYPEQAHTLPKPNIVERTPSSSARREDKIDPPFQQQSPRPPANAPETLDPNAGKPAGFNSLLRRMSSKKNRNQSPSPTKEPSPARDSLPSSFLSPGTLQPSTSGRSQYGSLNAQAPDPLVRRGMSMKITAKEKSDSRADLVSDKSSSKDRGGSKPNQDAYNYRSHNRSHSSAGKSHGYIPLEYLPPLPNINTAQIKNQASPEAVQAFESPKTHLQLKPSFHPTARAKSLGLHARKDSAYYRGEKDRPALPNTMAAQNSDDGVDVPIDSLEAGAFDDVTLDEAPQLSVPQLSEAQIIEQFNNAKRNSMPSIEYPKTLFLKGFFSVQTTSTKPLPVIRYNILSALSKLGVRFQEVKGGFLCVHANFAPLKEDTSRDHVTPTASTIIDEYRLDVNSEEKRLYGNAFELSSGSLQKFKDDAEGTRTPERETNTMKVPQIVTTPSQPSSKQPSRKGSLQISSPNTYTKGHKSSNSMTLGHRRKFSIGQSFLQNYRKKNGSQSLMPPNTPAAAKINRLLSGNGEIDDGDLDEETLAHMRKLSYDDSMDSINGELNTGGSDMLVSSRIEQRARHQHSNSVFSDEEAQKKSIRKTPLKFEINIVKVPLVGLYGVQFKKTLGNTWSYKTLASQILDELNL